MPLPARLPGVDLTDIFYLHGFASSAKSTKAAYFAERLRARGLSLRCPDFNEPDFRSLTITRMLDQLARDLDGIGPAAIVGSRKLRRFDRCPLFFFIPPENALLDLSGCGFHPKRQTTARELFGWRSCLSRVYEYEAALSDFDL